MPVAEFDAQGRLVNAEQAIGELVNTGGKALFEGYYKNDAADAQRMRDGMYWTGDLAYRDADGFLYFAGRDFEWLRVDGENFAAAPGRADPRPLPGRRARGGLRGARRGGGRPGDGGAPARRSRALRPRRPRRVPRRAERPRHEVVAALRARVRRAPLTQTSKVQKRTLRASAGSAPTRCTSGPAKGQPLRRLVPDDVAALRARFAERGREQELR